ncbi:MAG: hypothetical protein L6437_15345 [Kiritimatiellae bacterium]|nr:hypothetical protein [Verrucomicrobiota bacterium]MBU4366698.1 hypothetical protein [Verrucomicrobiota bacterium]MCG2661608.1 hypothetical protein [Kiritimatiellia bacterium]
MTTTYYQTGHEVAVKGFAALVEKLGPGGALRFIQQYEKGQGDYTEERKQLFRGITLAKIKQDIRSRS